MYKNLKKYLFGLFIICLMFICICNVNTFAAHSNDIGIGGGYVTTEGSGGVLNDNKLDSSLHEFVEQIGEYSRPVGAFLVFIGVLMVGFNIIKNRDNADERTKSMESLLWLAIGAGVIGGSLMISSFIWNTNESVQNPDYNPSNHSNDSNNEWDNETGGNGSGDTGIE